MQKYTFSNWGGESFALNGAFASEREENEMANVELQKQLRKELQLYIEMQEKLMQELERDSNVMSSDKEEYKKEMNYRVRWHKQMMQIKN